MTSTIHWVSEFAKVIACTKCTHWTATRLLRDDAENVPQPGCIGARYANTRVMLVGQNPGLPNTPALAFADRRYTLALRDLRDSPSDENYANLQDVLSEFIPSWPVHGNYFPLSECGIELDDIAYCNVVRCRTHANAMPGRAMTTNCTSEHFERWLELLNPRAVVFIGKWAHDHGAASVARLGIPFDFMNRQRSLSSAERVANRKRVVALVRGAG